MSILSLPHAVSTTAVTIVPGMGVTLHISDSPNPAFGVVTNVYTNAIGEEVAEIHLPGRPKQPATQATRLLKAVQR